MSWVGAGLAAARRASLPTDIAAGAVVALLLVPQGLAYALLAGLPAEVGLYASLPPLLVYAWLGPSREQSVGPMALTSLLTAATLSRFAVPGSADYVALAALLALLSGAMLAALGLARAGFLADFLSRPVLSAFTAASAVLIVASQLGSLVGVRAGGATLTDFVAALPRIVDGARLPALAAGGATLAWLWWARRRLAPTLVRLGVGQGLAELVARTAPVWAVAAATLVAARWPWFAAQPLLGPVTAGLPAPVWPAASFAAVESLLLPAFFIAMVNLVQGLSVAQWLAVRRGETVEPEPEMVALGAANVASGLFGGLPVTGGLSRSVVNAEAGAQSQFASLVTALATAAWLLFAAGSLATLPLAVLAAVIVVPVAAMIDLSPLSRAWRADRADGVAFAATFALSLAVGVDVGVVAGVLLSLGAWLAKSGRPHLAELGRLPGSEHFRNVARHPHAERLPGHLFLRVDDSLYFGNLRRVDADLWQRLAERPGTRCLVLSMSGVNRVDASAVDWLLRFDAMLAARGVVLWLAEVKGPVHDLFARAGALDGFDGRLFLSNQRAWQAAGGATADYAI
ncbi:SulP family sulfate permease [Crenobacter luteus]|uniref:Sulfate transporter n=1 Tax=Crenobacter luteus TaxID=1452487 RepID=A0A163CVA8_9NEIS|nr:SulP family inorganic anion transporter [Crenobacter luteus]KZE33256.1 sulfate transporter [Crenobacter luteus]TCP13658.1 SulP family sulfate permease [Crenobacter luteus]